ncbi:hypothetical protein ABKN59_007389 [Abortiporus biennis]
MSCLNPPQSFIFRYRPEVILRAQGIIHIEEEPIKAEDFASENHTVPRPPPDSLDVLNPLPDTSRSQTSLGKRPSSHKHSAATKVPRIAQEASHDDVKPVINDRQNPSAGPSKVKKEALSSDFSSSSSSAETGSDEELMETMVKIMAKMKKHKKEKKKAKKEKRKKDYQVRRKFNHLGEFCWIFRRSYSH